MATLNPYFVRCIDAIAASLNDISQNTSNFGYFVFSSNEVVILTVLLTITSWLLDGGARVTVLKIGLLLLSYLKFSKAGAILLVAMELSRLFFMRIENVKLKSCSQTETTIYRGTVYHKRTKLPGISPAQNSFRYPVHMLYIDVDKAEVDPDSVFSNFTGSWMWKINKPGIVAWYRKDHFGDPTKRLGDCVRELVAEHTKVSPKGPIMVLTNPRYFGYSFNPVNIYYCFDATCTQLAAVVLEVSNTPWLDKRLYVLPGTNGNESIKFRWNKDFHVSPFMNMEHDYQWNVAIPSDKLNVTAVNRAKQSTSSAHVSSDSAGKNSEEWIHTTGHKARTVQVSDDDEKRRSISFIVGLNCTRVPLSGLGPLQCLGKQPFMTFVVVLWIHLQAVVVALKGVSYQPPPVNSRPLDVGDAFKHLVVFCIAGAWMFFTFVVDRIVCWVLPLLYSLYLLQSD